MARLTIATAVLCLIGPAVWPALGQAIPLRVTQRDLVPGCLNGRAVPQSTRAWDVEPGPVWLVLSMRNARRPGRVTPEAGWASISFTAEASHRYEVEVRAGHMAFSTRRWRQGEWTPVVRDRTTNTIVSGEPEWTDGQCPAAGRRQ
ncbi:MAG: hypothetical protein OEW19_06665 [Acidobacteriota bacterium]|nr:hypothetical protein [Acidobacteriota bacterium]